MKLLKDLINKPSDAIDTMERAHTPWKTLLLIMIEGPLLMLNWFLSHLLWGSSGYYIVIIALSIAGIIIEGLFLYCYKAIVAIMMKLTGYKPIGKSSKIMTWCYLLPSVIYHGWLLLVNLVLINIGMDEIAGYLYDTFKYLLYIWIVSLSVVAINRSEDGRKIRNTLIAIGGFAANYLAWTLFNLWVLTTAYQAIV